MTFDPEYRFGPFQFSAAKGLYRDGVAIPVAPRVRDLLAALIAAEGAFVSKQELLRIVSADVDATDAVLWRAVYLLRKALDDAEATLVRTGYGRGVRLFAEIRPLADGNAVRPPVAAGPGEAARPLPGGISPHSSGSDMLRTAFELASKRNERQLQAASSVLELALERFPDLALAPSLQADIEVSRMIRGYGPARTLAARALTLVEKALAIQPGLPSALATKGWLLGAALDETAAGLGLIEDALSAAPGMWLAGFYKAWLLIGCRRLDEADAALEAALKVSPLERGLLGLKGWLLCAQRQFGEAERFIREALGYRPDIELLHILQAIVCVMKGDVADAMRQTAEALLLYPEDPFVEANHAWVLAKAGRRPEALAFLVRTAKSHRRKVSPVNMAMIRTALGDTLAARNALRMATAERDPWRLLAWCEPRLA